MPRDSNGVYTLPDGLPVPNTVISDTWMNATLDDVAAALTETVSIDGSVTPDHLSYDPAGFQAKLGLGGILTSVADRVNALISRNDAEIGSISSHGIASGVPAHMLLCEGQAVSRTTYSKLFAKVGTTWGAGDGVTTFNLPDLRAEWMKARGVGFLLAATQAATVPAHTHSGSTGAAGSHSHTATTASGGAHSHSASTDSQGAHTHTWSGSTGNNNVGHTHTWSGTTSTQAAHTHTLPYQHMSMHDSNTTAIASNGTGTSYSSSTAGAHTHSVSGTTSGVSVSHTHTYSGTGASAGGHTHALSVADNGAHTHTFTSASAGGHTHAVTINSTGGESRVRNEAAAMCIKYE